MTEPERNPRYYVVGGAVQPGRECYLQRAADAEVLQRVSDHEYCHVLAQPQAGKTSLAASTAARLRVQGVGVAVVDLTQAGAEDPSANAGRWYYSIAYRIARDLRLKVDLQGWWAERGGLTNLQRMREFFREIVLLETDGSVVIFLDRLEAVRDEPAARDILVIVRACYDARATVPEFGRLSFVMLGSVAADELVRQVQGSPFEISTPIQLEDFSPQEMAGLLPGLGDVGDAAEVIVSRVWSWTRGHPYLSQKVFRGLARRSEPELTVAVVDELVHTQFLAPSVLREEPHLSAIAERLLRNDGGRSARLNLYGRIRKGVQVHADPASVAQHELQMAGIIAVTPQGELRVRNEIYAMVFSTRWVNQNLPFGVRGIATAVAVLAALIALPVWYTEYLPRPYIRALTAVNQDYQVAEDAYNSLAALPGYRATADRLFIDFLERGSRAANKLSDVLRINSRLETLPEGQRIGAALLADFWSRQAAAKMHTGDRDGALVAAFEALQFPDEQPTRRRLAAELIGEDYRHLWATLYAAAPLRDVRADTTDGVVTLLDQRNGMQAWDVAGPQPVLLQGERLFAEEQLQVEQRKTFTDFPASPRLLLEISHERPADVQVRLRGPGGTEAVVRLSEAESLSATTYAMDFAAFPQLQALLASAQVGNWSIAITDLTRGGAGEFRGWDIVPRSVASLSPERLIRQPIPEPRASVNALAQLSADGRRALSWPVNPDTPGPILVWDTRRAEIKARIPRSPALRAARFVLGGSQVLTVDARTLQLWDADTGAPTGQFSPATPGQPRVSFSPSGQYAAIPVEEPDAVTGVEVRDLQSMRRLRTIAVAGESGALALSPAAQYLAVGGRGGLVQLWSVTTGQLLREYLTGAAVTSIEFDPSGRWLAVVDAGHTLRVWSVASAGEPVYERNGNSEWRLGFSADGQRLLQGSPDRAYQLLMLDDRRRRPVGLRHAEAAATSGVSIAPLLLSRRGIAVTVGSGRSVKLWQLPDDGGGRGVALTAGLRTALSADGTRIAAGTRIGDLRLHIAGAPGGLPLATRKPLAGAGEPQLVSLRFSPNRRLLAAGTADGEVYVWNDRGAVPLAVRVQHTDGAVRDLLFSENGDVLFSASGSEVQATDTRSGATLGRLRIRADNPQLAFAAAADELFIAGDESGVTRWRYRDGFSAMVVPGAARVTRVAATRTGRRIVTASADRQLTLWDINRRVPFEPTVSAAATVDTLWLDEDGRRLIVQAGSWLHGIAVLPGGLSSRATRLLAAAPAALQPDANGLQVTVLMSLPGRAKIDRIALNEPPDVPLYGDARQLRLDWQRRLGLTLDSQGRIVPSSVAGFTRQP